MEIFYFVVFAGLAAVVAALELSKSSRDRINSSSAFNAFKNNYLVVYSLMMGTFPLGSDHFPWLIVTHLGFAPISH